MAKEINRLKWLTKRFGGHITEGISDFVIGFLRVKLPFLNSFWLAPIRWILTKVLEHYTYELFIGGAKGLNVIIVGVKTEKDYDNYIKVLEEIKDLPDEEADEKIKDALRDLIRIGRSKL